MAVIFEGREWRLRVPPTPEGAMRFKKQIELITGMPYDQQVGLTMCGDQPATAFDSCTLPSSHTQASQIVIPTALRLHVEQPKSL